MRLGMFVIGAAACALICGIAPAAEKMYSMGRGRGVLVLNVPDEWDDYSCPPGEGSDEPAHIEFSAYESDQQFSMKVGPFPPPSKGGPLTTQPAMLKTLLRRMTENPIKPLDEKHLHPIEGKGARGYWVDGNEDAAEFDPIHQSGGVVGVGNVIVTVEIRHQKDSPSALLAREMLASATLDKSARTEAAVAAAAAEPMRRIQSPDGTWDLVFDAGLQARPVAKTRDGKTRTLMTFDSSGLLWVTVLLEPAAKPEAGDDATVAREYYLAQQKRTPTTEPIRPYEISQEMWPDVEDMAGARNGWVVRRSNGAIIGDQRRVCEVYLAHGGVWVTIYASTFASRGAEAVKAQRAMDALFSGIHIEPRSPATKPAGAAQH
jgi:hypothetical protein